MILALDTSTAACTAALLAEDGECIAAVDEQIGRGHAERLVPMIQSLLAGRRPDRVLVGCGPGSFTGLRVGLAAAHGLAIGWGVPLNGFSSLALLALAAPAGETIAAAMPGGHGELFVQQFAGAPLRAAGPLLNLPPQAAADAITASTIVGPGAELLVTARNSGRALPAWPRAADAGRLPAAMLLQSVKPIYGRSPDARAREAA